MILFKKKIKSTVIFPTFGSASFSKWALKSVCDQTVIDIEIFIICDGSPKEMINTANLAGVSVNDTIARFTGGGWTVRQLAEKYNSRTGNYTFPLLTIEDVVAFFHSNFIDELVFHHAGHSGMLADPEFTGYMMDVETRYMARTTYRLLTGDSGYTALLDSLKRVYIVNYNDELITQTAFELNQMKTGF